LTQQVRIDELALAATYSLLERRDGWAGFHDEVFDEELHHSLAIDAAVPPIGSDLEVKALSRLLQLGDELHHV